MQAQCTSEIALQLNTSSDDAGDLEQELQEIEDNICPNSCSQQGSCSNGTCICDKGKDASIIQTLYLYVSYKITENN